MTRYMFHGSVENRLEEGRQYGELHVGMGATEMLYTDRHAYTVQKIVSDKRVIVTRDKAVLNDGCSVYGRQEYTYTSVPLVEGPREWQCFHPLNYMFDGGCTCHTLEENGTCEGCPFYKNRRKTNGIELRKCKNGWKRTGTEDYFTLGVREEYYDPSF